MADSWREDVDWLILTSWIVHVTVNTALLFILVQNKGQTLSHLCFFRVAMSKGTGCERMCRIPWAVRLLSFLSVDYTHDG